LQRARQHLDPGTDARVDFVECDITCMPFGDSEFDLVVCFSGLHCLPDPAAAVREMARCMRTGGRLIADVALRRQLRRTDILMTLGRAAGIFGPPATLADVRRWFSDAGLTIATVTQAGALACVEAHQ
jgi:ubiquinone/menaquinone biosynthesis C-methylase UbiE